jgi:hypothetical protein
MTTGGYSAQRCFSAGRQAGDASSSLHNLWLWSETCENSQDG